MSVFTALTGAVAATDTTITVDDASDFPLGQIRIAINAEEMLAQNDGTTTWEVERDEQPADVPLTVAYDNFDRVDEETWGHSADGFGWQSATSETDRTFSVTGGQGVIEDNIGGTAPNTAAPRLSSGDGPLSTELRYRFTLDKPADTANILLEARPREHSNSTRDRYLARVQIEPDNDMTIRLLRRVAGVETNIGSLVTKTGLFAVDTWFWVAVQAIGDGTTTTLNGKLWKESDGEPGTWDCTGTDTNATMQTPGYSAMKFDTPVGATNLPVTLGIREWTYLRVPVGTSHADGDTVVLVDEPLTPAIDHGYGPPEHSPPTGTPYLETGAGGPRIWWRIGAGWHYQDLT